MGSSALDVASVGGEKTSLKKKKSALAHACGVVPLPGQVMEHQHQHAPGVARVPQDRDARTTPCDQQNEDALMLKELRGRLQSDLGRAKSRSLSPIGEPTPAADDLPLGATALSTTKQLNRNRAAEMELDAPPQQEQDTIVVEGKSSVLRGRGTIVDAGGQVRRVLPPYSGKVKQEDLVQPPHPLHWWACQPCCVYRERGCDDPAALAGATVFFFVPLTSPERMEMKTPQVEVPEEERKNYVQMYEGPYKWAWNEEESYSFAACFLHWTLKYDKQKAADTAEEQLAAMMSPEWASKNWHRAPQQQKM